MKSSKRFGLITSLGVGLVLSFPAARIAESVPVPASQRVDPIWLKRLPIDPDKPPTGPEMVLLLFGKLDVPLVASLPNCGNDPKSKRTLRHELATLLGGALEQGRGARLSGGCTAGEREVKGKVESVWSCTLNVVVEGPPGGESAPGSVRFELRRRDWFFFRDSLWCS